MRKKKYFFPALSSALIIGLGQILKGDSNKGLKWILFFYLFLPALSYASLLIHGYLFLGVFTFALIVYPIFWIYNILDAFLAPV